MVKVKPASTEAQGRGVRQLYENKIEMATPACSKEALDWRGSGLLAYATVPGLSYNRRPVSCRLYSLLEFSAPEKTMLDNQDSITSFIVHILRAVEQFLLPGSITVNITDDLIFHVNIDDNAYDLSLSDLLAAHKAAGSLIISRFSEGVRPFLAIFIPRLSTVLDILLISNGTLDFPLDAFPLTKCLTENVVTLGDRYRDDPLNNEVHSDCLLAVLFNLALVAVEPSHLNRAQQLGTGISNADITEKIISPLTRLSRCLWMLIDPAFSPVFKYKGLRTMRTISTPHQFSTSLIGVYISDLVEMGFFHPGEAYDKILLKGLSLKELLKVE